jgi:hypothetical protein
MSGSESRCTHCKRPFTHPTRLPPQHICRECFYEHRGDFTGAIEEIAYQAGFNTGRDRAIDETQDVEAIAKLLELLPLDHVIALCHPDRHPEERNRLANTVTAQLLELRTALRSVA